ncbi:MAG: hypothetical protein BroJett039_04600 [Chloroflexota bacterium]|nr:MAG: hypothetical protein BroJett039_04600 [Chloroflexota bacterium]
MRQNKKAALDSAAWDRTTNAGSGLNVSAREDNTTARACQTAAARAILAQMLATASRKNWTRVLDALLELRSKWTERV